MASETVEQVCKRLNVLGPFAFDGGNIVGEILAAHKSELAAVSSERDEWQKQALEENAALDFARSELEAKDAEIARLKRDNFDINGCLLAEQELAEKRNALIKELADALNSYLIGECIDCGAKCEGDGACVHQKNLRALVKKSREVVSKTETTTEGGK